MSCDENGTRKIGTKKKKAERRAGGMKKEKILESTEKKLAASARDKRYSTRIEGTTDLKI